MRSILKNISPFNNRSEMSGVEFIIKKTLAFWLCYIVGLFIAEGLVILLHFAMGKNMLVGDVFDNQTITLIIYYGYLVVIAVVLFYWKVVEKKSLSELGLAKGFGSYFVGIGVGVLMLLLSVGAIVLTGDLKYQGVFETIDIGMLILFAGGFVVQGAMEELLCRGFLFHALREKTSVVIAGIVSTIMFVVPHWSSLFAGNVIYGILGIINMCLISVIFLLLTIRCKNIWAACGCHSFWNFVLYSVLGMNLSGNDETSTAIFNMQSVGTTVWNGGSFGIEASAMTTVVLVVFIMLLSLKKESAH